MKRFTTSLLTLSLVCVLILLMSWPVQSGTIPVNNGSDVTISSKNGTVPMGNGSDVTFSSRNITIPVQNSSDVSITTDRRSYNTTPLADRQATVANSTVPGKVESMEDINCVLYADIADIGESMVTLVTTAGYKILRLDLIIVGDTGPYNRTVPGDLYNPYHWILTTGDTGQAMLMLRDTLVPMSLNILGKGIGYMQVGLVQEPANCMATITIVQANHLIRDLILNNFGYKTDLRNSETEVCSRHVVSQGDGETTGELVYRCCGMNVEHEITCEVVDESIWLRVLFVAIIVMQLLVILYFPLFLPESLYTDRKNFTEYVYNVESDKTMTLAVKHVTDVQSIGNDFVPTKLHTTAHLDTFRRRIATLTPNVVYTIYVKRVLISARGSKMLAEGTAHAGIFDFIKRFFCQCRMRMDIKSVADCCNQNMFKYMPRIPKFLWHECLQYFMLLVTIGMLCVPLIIRLMFYFGYESSYVGLQKHALESRNMTVAFTGSIVTYLSPDHPVFIVVYVSLPLVGLMFMCAPGALKRYLKYNVWKCFSDMKKTKNRRACGVFTSYILWPLTLFGVLGCLVMPVWLILLPVFVLVLGLEVFPVVNLTIRYIVNLVYYINKAIPCTTSMAFFRRSNRTNDWLNNRIVKINSVQPTEGHARGSTTIHAIALGIFIICMWFIIILAAECLSFYVECAVYLLIAFVLQPGQAMKYMSVVMLIGIYGHQSFTGVQKKYSAYCKAIHVEIQALFEEELKATALLSADEQENTTFRVSPPSTSVTSNKEKLKLILGSEGHLKWKADRLILFLDKEDIPYIPKQLLQKLATMPHFFCPGKMHILYIWALLDFAKILVFLFFVFIVVFAFGQTSVVSTGKRSVVGLGTGFLPLVLRKFLFTAESVDKRNLRWYAMFMNAIECYADRWHPVDIEIDDVHEGLEVKTKEPDTGESTDKPEDEKETKSVASDEIKIGENVSEKVGNINNVDEGKNGNIDMKEADQQDNYKPSDTQFHISNDISNGTSKCKSNGDPPKMDTYSLDVYSQSYKESHDEFGDHEQHLPLCTLGSTTFLTGDEDFEPLPEYSHSGVDLIVLSTGMFGDESMEFYLPDPKIKKRPVPIITAIV